MSEMTPTLYLPIEDAARELDAKALVAAAAVQRGLSVVIGQQWLIANNHAHMPLGLMVFKGMNARQANAMRAVSAHGHLTGASDEEALGLANMSYIQRDIDTDLASYCDLFLAQGRLHSDAIAGKTGASKEKILEVGNPRIDLLRAPFKELSAAQARNLRGEHGEYILVNTNIGAVNSVFGGVEEYKEVVIRIGWMDPNKAEDNALFDAIVAYDHANLSLSRAAIAKLSKAFPRSMIVLRPHGSERIDTWQEYCTKYANVKVIHKGRHLSWILGARAMVHTCCTTGLEAEILGQTAVNLRPKAHKGLLHRVFIANIANLSVDTPSAVAELLRTVLNGDSRRFDQTRPARLAALAAHIHGIEDTFTFAHERIAEVAVNLLTSHGAVANRFSWEPTDRENYLGAVRRTQYQLEKINLSKTDFERTWRELTTLSGMNIPVRIEQIGDSLFLIEQN